MNFRVNWLLLACYLTGLLSPYTNAQSASRITVKNCSDLSPKVLCLQFGVIYLLPTALDHITSASERNLTVVLSQPRLPRFWSK